MWLTVVTFIETESRTLFPGLGGGPTEGSCVLGTELHFWMTEKFWGWAG